MVQISAAAVKASLSSYIFWRLLSSQPFSSKPPPEEGWILVRSCFWPEVNTTLAWPLCAGVWSSLFFAPRTAGCSKQNLQQIKQLYCIT